MKKVILAVIVAGLALGLTACGSTEEKTGEAKSSVEQNSSKENEEAKMKSIETGLDEKGVEVSLVEDFLYFTREKGIDYDYFEFIFIFSKEDNKIIEITLQLKGNIDGKKKDRLYYEVSKGRIVESSTMSNTDIDALAEVLESLDYSDKDLVEFAQWYYDNN